MRTDLEYIAEANGLELIDTSSARNGYPENLQRAIIGFDTFEDAKMLAEEHGLSIEIFSKLDGWGIWYRTSNHAWEAFERSSDEYGDDYRQYSKDDLESFYVCEVQPNVDGFDSFASLREYLDKMEEIRDKIEDADDDELVLASCYGYYDTVKKTTMSYCYDTVHFAIGLIDRQGK